MLKKLYSVLPKKADIRFSGVTGYGEQLIKNYLDNHNIKYRQVYSYGITVYLPVKICLFILIL